MGRSANIHVRIDPETKVGAEALFSSFGMTVSDAINIFLHQSVLVGGLPFEVRQPKYNAETLAAMREARDIMDGKRKAKTYKSIGEMNADLDGEE